jgi:hypothetical protein
MNQKERNFLQGVATGVQTLLFSNENYNLFLINGAHVEETRL